MVKIKVNRKIFYTTSSIKHRSGLYPVWDSKLKFKGFVNHKEVKFIK